MLLRGVGWNRMPVVLAEEFGHLRQGKYPLSARSLMKIIISPVFWGHNARFFRRDNASHYAQWMFDETIPPPPPVEIAYHVFPAVYTGEQATAIKAELRRRMAIGAGNAPTRYNHALTGLVLCAACGRRMTFSLNQYGVPRYRCNTAFFHRTNRRVEDCHSSPQFILDTVIRAEITKLLTLMLDNADPLYLQRQQGAGMVQVPQRIEKIEADISKTEAVAGKLILQKAELPDELRAILDEKITQTAQKLRALKAQLAEQKSLVSQSQSQHELAKQGFNDLLQTPLEVFWQLPELRINQILTALMGDMMFACLNGALVGVQPRPKHHSKLP